MLPSQLGSSHSGSPRNRQQDTPRSRPHTGRLSSTRCRCRAGERARRPSLSGLGRLRIAVDAHYGCEGCDLLTHVEFRSNRFPGLEGEEELINPDLWGKQLADFLSDGLRTEGFETTEPIAEDWGWRLNVINDTIALSIGCGHYQEYDDGYLCFIEPHEPFVWKPFRRVGTRDRVAALQQAMNKVLGEDVGIRAMRWWTYEDFNHPSRFSSGPNR
jgi:hypothetical protein